MSPEQIRSTMLDETDATSAVDCRSDVYSLGVVFCELLSGSHPFGPVSRGELPSQLARPLLDRQRDLSRTSLRGKSGVDSKLAQTVQNCLATDPVDRPQTAELLHKEFGKSLRPTRRAVRWARTHPQVVTLVVSLLVGVGLALSVFAATRDPYDVRQFKQGMEFLRKHDFEGAALCFTRALDANDDVAAYWFARGLARRGKEDFGAAVEDFVQASIRNSDAPCSAAIGYCYARQGDWPEAKCHLLGALEEGKNSAVVYACLGYCHFQVREYALAKDCLDTAIEKNPDLAAAYHMRALNEASWSASEARLPSSVAVSDIEAVTQLNPKSPWGFETAAFVYYRYLTNADPQVRVEKVLDLLERATSNGLNQDSVAPWGSLAEFRENSRLADLVERAGGQAETKKEDELLPDPVADWCATLK